MTWLKQTTDASWSTVVRALVGIKMGALAQKIAVKYGESFPHKILSSVKRSAPSRSENMNQRRYP